MAAAGVRPSMLAACVLSPALALFVYANCPKPWGSLALQPRLVDVGYPVVYRTYLEGLVPLGTASPKIAKNAASAMPPEILASLKFSWASLGFNIAFGVGLLAIVWLVDWAVRSRQFSLSTLLLLMVLSAVQLGMYLAVPPRPPAAPLMSAASVASTPATDNSMGVDWGLQFEVIAPEPAPIFEEDAAKIPARPRPAGTR